jgi:CheY-like chemotaxis protein
MGSAAKATAIGGAQPAAPDGQAPAIRNATVRRVLVVDDDDEDRVALARLLSDLGLEVLMGSSGREGLDLAHEARPDLITLAGMLPDITSGSVLRQLKDHPVTSAIPVVLMVEPSMDPIGFGGQAAVIVKPAYRDDLLRTVADLEGASGTRPAQ